MQAEEILNKKSGWKALTGTTDFSEIAVANPPTKAHKLAFDIFVDRILGYIGNYYVKLNGQVDAVVFAGGIGEKSALLRQTLADKLQCLGVALDAAANDKGPGDGETVKDISAGGGKGPRVLVCQTNEQVSVLQSRRSMIQSVWREVQPFWRVYAGVLIWGWILANMALYCSSRWHTTASVRGAEFIICEVSSFARGMYFK